MGKNQLMLVLCLGVVSVFGLVASHGVEHAKTSIIGKWRVASDNPENTKNHTYEFLLNGTCIEKYRSWQMVGPTTEPPRSEEEDAVITYRFRPLGGKRYRLFLVQSLVGGQPTQWSPTWHILDVTITKDKAKVYVADRQEWHSAVAKNLLETAQKVQPGLKFTNREQEAWVRVLSK